MERLAPGTSFALPYGAEALTFRVPDGPFVARVEPAPASPVADPLEAVRSAVCRPLAGPSLRELARPGQRVCIVVTDATRPCPDSLIAPVLVEELLAAGVSEEDITFLVGVGMHRASTAAEKVAKLGPAIVSRFRVFDHDAQDRSGLVLLGVHDETGTPIWVNRLVAEADLVIATGVVEPHQFAGYSGGGKTAVIGAGGEETIAHSHGPALLDHPRTRLGNLDGNLFHALVREATRRLNLQFIVNVVLNHEDALVAVYAGEPEAVFAAAVARAREIYTVAVPGPWDAVVAGIARPKDVNLYQVSRAATYLVLGPEPVVRRGGVIVLAAEAPEGAGQGEGERTFLRLLRDAGDPARFIERARREGYGAGGQRAYLMAQVLVHCTVAVVGTRHPQVVRDLHMVPLRGPDDAWAFIAERCGPGARVLVVPHPLRTVPMLTG